MTVAGQGSHRVCLLKFGVFTADAQGRGVHSTVGTLPATPSATLALTTSAHRRQHCPWQQVLSLEWPAAPASGPPCLLHAGPSNLPFVSIWSPSAGDWAGWWDLAEEEEAELAGAVFGAGGHGDIQGAAG